MKTKMSENTMTLSYETNAQNVSTNNVENLRNKSNIANDATKSTTLMRQPSSEIKNNEDVDEVITTQDVAENLAVNSNNVNKRNAKLTVESDEVESASKSNLDNSNTVPDSDVVHHIRKKNYYYKRSRQNILANALIKRSIRCLNKMHVMEDVHEGCNAQPSSPGHADQRQDIMDICNESEISTKDNENLSQIENENELKITEIKSENIEENKLIVKIENINADNNNSPLSEPIPNTEADVSHANDDSISSDSTGENALKRKLDADSTIDSPSKRLHAQIQKSFFVRDEILSKYMESIGCNTLEQIQSNTEQIMSEIRKLNEIAKQKEKEWNSILHLKKMKEELLIRLQRQKQLILLNNDDFESEYAFGTSEERYQNMNNDSLHKSKTNSIKTEMRSPNYLHDKHGLSSRQRSFNGKSMIYNHYDINGQNDYRQGKARPTLDVKSLIADYRQKHPETVPRRGRRIRTALPQCETKMSACGVLNLSNVALGSGAQVRQNLTGHDLSKDVGLLMNNCDEMRKDNPNPDTSQHSDSTSFKDMLAQFAKLSQAERQEILQNAVKPPPPYPEVTVHPVPTTSASTSLLHGILTKNQTKSESKSTFSPTLARLLTAPEKTSPQSSVPNQGNGVASITDILCNSKARNEITITPVVGQYEMTVKGKSNQMEEDETEDSVDRLVIDESGEVVDARSKDNNSDIGDEVPQCQGCNQKPAQFVCAGCANQWYCSRDCQVSAWDEHSEVCSG